MTGKQIWLNGIWWNISYTGRKYFILSNGIRPAIRVKKSKVEKLLKGNRKR